ncbi:hypothetical protein ACKKBG_A16965 [Auxenochlorella protothecoides x Auxenochlorella symbiontica]
MAVELARRGGGYGLVGVTMYYAWDALGDAAIYLTTKRHVMDAAQSHNRLLSKLGTPVNAGPWYDSSVVIGRGGHTASVTLPLKGPERGSDVTVKLVRAGGFASSTLFSLLQGDQWEVMLMDAAVGMGPGGRPVLMSLLEAEEPQLKASDAHGNAALARRAATVERKQ